MAEDKLYVCGILHVHWHTSTVTCILNKQPTVAYSATQILHTLVDGRDGNPQSSPHLNLKAESREARALLYSNPP
jgi:hypothetical protein